MNEQIRLLCVDDERNVLRSLQRLFFDEGYEVLTATSGREGLEILEQEGPVQVVISDYRMPDVNGVEFLGEVCRLRPDSVRIVLSGYADTASVVAAINDGQIYKFIPKPWNDDDLKVTIANALEKYFLAKRNRELLEDLRASNEKLSRIYERLETVVQEHVAALLQENRELALARDLLETLPMPVLACDAEGVVFRNRQARNIGDADLPKIRRSVGRSARINGGVFQVRELRMKSQNRKLTVLVLGPEEKRA